MVRSEPIDARQPLREIEPGLYRHYKGGRYRVLFVAKDATNKRNGQAGVIYVSLTNGHIYARDLGEFAEAMMVPAKPRFERIPDDSPVIYDTNR